MSRDNKKFAAANDYEIGSLPPSGYVQWHEWAAAQHRGGLRQKQQPCGHWLFPQEIGVHQCPCSPPPQTEKP